MTLVIDADRAKSHEEILTFKKACDDVRNNGPLSVPLIQTKELFKFSKSLLIGKYDAEKNDFVATYCGSEISDVFGFELTKKYMKEIASEAVFSDFLDVFKHILKTGEVSYFSNDLTAIGKGYLCWDQISFPLERNGAVNEVVSFVTINGA